MTAPTKAPPTKAPPTDTGACGKRGGYNRHRRAGEQPCRRCLDAVNEAARDRRNRVRPMPDMSRAVRVTATSQFGRVAATPAPHPFRPMSVSQCADCFGWRDDYRHLGPVR